MFIIDEEKQKRKELRILLEAENSMFDDKHGNEHKCLTVTDVMRVLLEDKEISDLSESIKKLAWIRNDMVNDNTITPDAGLAEAFDKCSGLGVTPTVSEQSKDKI